jgi:hypothetical protein
MNEHKLVWAMLPEGLEPYFDIYGFEKSEDVFRIILVEKNIIPKDLPTQYHGKKVINSVLNDLLIDDFPIQGKKGEILIRKRSWKFKGVEGMYSRDLKFCCKGTRISKGFAAFLKEFD